MGRSMYNFGKQSKEKARQQKQIEKAAKRLNAKQQKANLKARNADAGTDVAESDPIEETL
ncbi:MAG: hypothetical protein JW943_17365 [Deltaproteobacteria bacterium]|nr:hypothetical protein [Deltaproteobacteria bacterium]